MFVGEKPYKTDKEICHRKWIPGADPGFLGGLVKHRDFFWRSQKNRKCSWESWGRCKPPPPQVGSWAKPRDLSLFRPPNVFGGLKFTSNTNHFNVIWIDLSGLEITVRNCLRRSIYFAHDFQQFGWKSCSKYTVLQTIFNVFFEA